MLPSNLSTGSLASLDSTSRKVGAKTSTKNLPRRASRHSLDKVDLLDVVSPTAAVQSTGGGDDNNNDPNAKSLTLTGGLGGSISSALRRASSVKASSMLTALFGALNESGKSNNDHSLNSDSSSLSRIGSEVQLKHGLPSTDSIDERILQSTSSVLKKPGGVDKQHSRKNSSDSSNSDIDRIEKLIARHLEADNDVGDEEDPHQMLATEKSPPKSTVISTATNDVNNSSEKTVAQSVENLISRHLESEEAALKSGFRQPTELRASCRLNFSERELLDDLFRPDRD